MIRHHYRTLYLFITSYFYRLASAVIIQNSGGPSQLFNHVISHHRPITTEDFNPTSFTISDALYSKSYLKPANDIYGSSFSFGDFTFPFLSTQDPLEYIVNGRVLKQYLVMEDHGEDNSIESLFNNPFHQNSVVPFLPTNFNRIKPDRSSQSLNLNFLQQQIPQIPINPNFPQLSNQQAPTSLGSGALGYIRLANGAVYIGSGSLGYISNQDRANEIANVRNRQTPPPGPLTFGHANSK